MDKPLPMVKDVIHGPIEITLLEKKIISHYFFNRLHSVKQQSLVYRVFPGATHTRFAHSIGTMHVASKIFKYGLSNTHPAVLEDFFSFKRKLIEKKAVESQEEIIKIYLSLYKKLYNGRGSSGNISEEELDDRVYRSLLKLIRPEGTATDHYIEADEFKNFTKRRIFNNTTRKNPMIECILGREFASACLIPGSIQMQITYALLLEIVRLKALLHDLGHLPFSHTTEAAFERFLRKNEDLHKDEHLDLHSTKTEQLHEGITKKVDFHLIEAGIQSLLDQCLTKKLERTYDEQDNQRLLELSVYAEILPKLTSKFEEFMPGIYYTVISAQPGLPDADRIDYILRDGASTGLLLGSGDYKRVYKSFTLVKIDNRFIGSTPKNPNKGEAFIKRNKFLFSVFKNCPKLSKAFRENVEKRVYEIDKKTFIQVLKSDYAGAIFALLPHVDAYNDVIQLMLDRYKIYKHVNNHHRVKRLDGTLVESIYLLLKLGHSLQKATTKTRRDCNTQGKYATFDRACEMYRIFLGLRKELYTDTSNIWAIKSILFKFTDDWLVTALADIYNEIRGFNNLEEWIDELTQAASKLSLKKTSSKRSARRRKTYISNNSRTLADLIVKEDLRNLALYLDEFFQRKAYFSLWKKESDYKQLLCQGEIISLYKKLLGKEGDCENLRCFMGALFSLLYEKYPHIWERLYSDIKAHFNDLYGQTLAAPCVVKNDPRLGVSENKPIWLVEYQNANMFVLYTASDFTRILCSLAEDAILNAPLFIYYPKSYQIASREDLAKQLFTFIHKKLHEYHSTVIEDETGKTLGTLIDAIIARCHLS